MYYLHQNPKELSDDDWAIAINQVLWCLKREQKINNR